MKKNKFLKAVNDTALRMKAEDIKVLDLGKFETCGEYYIIMTANSAPHIRALMREVTAVAEALKIPVHHVEGLHAGRWVLIDCMDVIVHIFTKEERDFYNIERLWDSG